MTYNHLAAHAGTLALNWTNGNRSVVFASLKTFTPTQAALLGVLIIAELRVEDETGFVNGLTKIASEEDL